MIRSGCAVRAAIQDHEAAKAKETWSPTKMLRWAWRDVDEEGYSRIQVLQQRWTECMTGRQEWRDVPTVASVHEP